jgi:hypothetical protein
VLCGLNYYGAGGIFGIDDRDKFLLETWRISSKLHGVTAQTTVFFVVIFART